jgi:hypothetical protein
MSYTTTSVSFEVSRPLTDWEMDDVRQAIENIMASKTFFYAGDDDLGDEVRAFMVMNPMTSNLEFIPADGEAS